MSKRSQLLTRTVLGWAVGLLMAFPVFWMALAAFKTEQGAAAVPPLLFFEPTLENFAEMNQRIDYVHHAFNSVVVSFTATALAIGFGAPAAYVTAFHQSNRTRSIMLWMLSTKFMPAVGVLVPVYLILVWANLLDTRIALVVITFLANLPLVVWMLFSYFKEVPPEILEAGRMDGARPLTQMRYLLLPLTAPGIASTALLSIILAWNECLLVHQRHLDGRRHAGPRHRVLRQFRGPFLGKALGRLARFGRADSAVRLADAAAARARPHLRRREVGDT